MGPQLAARGAETRAAVVKNNHRAGTVLGTVCPAAAVEERRASEWTRWRRHAAKHTNVWPVCVAVDGEALLRVRLAVEGVWARAWPAAGDEWMDGSFTADLPRERLVQLFHVTQNVVSQVNPHVSATAHSRTRQAYSAFRRGQRALGCDLASFDRLLGGGMK